APLRPNVESLADLPYLHRSEAYHCVEQFALANNIPIWNFDNANQFNTTDFLDPYHLTPYGARKLTKKIADKFERWQSGITEQDVTALSANSARTEIKDSLIRTIFHF
ncbi:MAG: hypothetical protein ABI778_09435, partial [Ignavibacteriota bacterium]